MGPIRAEELAILAAKRKKNWLGVTRHREPEIEKPLISARINFVLMPLICSRVTEYGNNLSDGENVQKSCRGMIYRVRHESFVLVFIGF